MKLHLGCGRHYLHGWVNADERDDAAHGVKVDLKTDATTLVGVGIATCDVIYASHLLEHFEHARTVNVLRTWFSRLKNGGKLWLSVPDFKVVAGLYIKHHENMGAECMRRLNALVYGGQEYSGNYHYAAFDYAYLEGLLSKVGFRGVRRLDSIPIAGLTDYSTCEYWNTPISLNVEALRPS